jgi:two-component system phosphate regulon response regulator OmpR
MAENGKILLVDDDPRVRTMLVRYLEGLGFAVQAVGSGVQMDRHLEREYYDLLLLDVMMPGEDGFSICRRLRAQEPHLPIIMLTARGDLSDRVEGLDVGADDYLPKPFEPRELTARIRAVLRRSQEIRTVDPAPGAIEFGPFRLALDTRSLWRGAEKISLTDSEFSILHALASHAWQPLSRERLLAMSHGNEEVTAGSRGVDVFISRLRRIVETDPGDPRYIQTVWGRGYVLVPDGGNAAAERDET